MQIPLLVLLIVGSGCTAPHLYSRVRARETRDSFTVLESRRLSDGTKHERIREHLEELPPLPQEYDEIVSPVGKSDVDGDVLVPVDEAGNLLPGYEHVVQPHVYQMTKEDIDRLNHTTSRRKDTVPIEIPEYEIMEYPREQIENEEEELVGSDYDQIDSPAARLPSARDYVNSQEKEDVDNEMVYDLDDPTSADEPPLTGVFVNHMDEVEKEEQEIDKLEEEIRYREKEVESSEDILKEIEEDVVRIQDDAGKKEVAAVTTSVPTEPYEKVLDKMEELERGVAKKLDSDYGEMGAGTPKKEELEEQVIDFMSEEFEPKIETTNVKVLQNDDEGWEQQETPEKTRKTILRGGKSFGNRPDSGMSFGYLSATFMLITHMIL